MADIAKRSAGRIVAIAILSVTTIVCLLPVVSVVIAGLLASHFGCHLDEGSVHPCPAFGTDIGEMLYTLGVMGWLMLITIPIFVFVLVGWSFCFSHAAGVSSGRAYGCASSAALSLVG